MQLSANLTFISCTWYTATHVFGRISVLLYLKWGKQCVFDTKCYQNSCLELDIPQVAVDVPQALWLCSWGTSWGCLGFWWGSVVDLWHSQLRSEAAYSSLKAQIYWEGFIDSCGKLHLWRPDLTAGNLKFCPMQQRNFVVHNCPCQEIWLN